MITWAMASLRRRATAALGVFLAVFIGVSITTATTQVMAAAGPQPPERLQGASVMVAGEQATNVLGQAGDRSAWSTERLTELTQGIRSVPGVSEVVADRTFLAQIVTPTGALPEEDPQVAGHGWSSASLAPYALTTGTEPISESEVVLGPEFGAAVGETVTLRTAQHERQVTVAGTTDGPGVYVDNGTAERLAPAVTLVGVQIPGNASAAAAVEAVAAQFGGEVVTDRSALQDASVAKSRYLSNQFLTALALASVVVSLFVVAVTSKFAVDERTQEFGLLRASGALPKQLRRVVLLEAVLLGTVGSVAGAAAGLAATTPLATLLRSWGILPAQFVVTVDWAGAVATVLGGIAIAMIGAAFSAVSASRVSPLAAMRPEAGPSTAHGRSRTITGTALASLVVVEVVAGRMMPGLDSVVTAIVVALTSAIAAACLSPVVVPRLAQTLLWLPWRLWPSAPLMVGGAEVTTNPRRSGSLAAPAIIAAALAVLTSGFIPTMRIAYPAESAGELAGQSVVVSSGAGYLTADQVSRVRERYDVVEVGLTSRARIVTSGSAVVLPVTALPNGAEPTGFEVPRYLSDEKGWRTGDFVTMVMADGAAIDSAITAIVDEPRGERPGVALAESVIRSNDPSAVADEVFVRSSSVQPAIDPPADTRVMEAMTWSQARYDKDLTLLDRYVTTFVVVAVGYAVLAAAITIAMSMRHRRDQISTLARTGAVKRQIKSVVVIEAVVAGGCGVLLGAMCALVPLYEMAAGLSETTGSEVGAHLDWLQAAMVPLGIVGLMGVTASVMSGRRGPAKRY